MAIDPKIAAKLKSFNKNFAKQKERAQELGGFAEVPDGKYLATLDSAELRFTKNGALNFVFHFKITESAEDESLVGVQVNRWCDIDTKEDGMGYLLKDLARFGIQAETSEQLAEIADLLTSQKPEVKISLKTNTNGSQFSYIDAVISEIDAGDHVSEESEEGENNEDEEIDEDSGTDEIDAEDVGIEIGTEVSFSWKGSKLTGVIKEIDEENEKLKVSSGGKVYPVKLVDVSIPEAEEEVEIEEEEEIEEVEEEEIQKKPAPKKEKPVAKKPAVKAKPAAKKKK